MIRILLLVSALLSYPTCASTLQALEQLQWHHRIILVQCETQACQQTSAEQLKEASSEIQERHIVWFVSTSEELMTNVPVAIGERLYSFITSEVWGRPQILLIGKDGEVKATTDAFELESLFKLIDQMPMRQAEMSWQRISTEVPLPTINERTVWF